ncbi:MAG TPA: ABC transporter substrate-binding protein [Spongiibacteraceae bacterium]|nr:ABC transporter substrate-binding protein [Spongiibacteraceae bacterium]
MNWKAEPQFGGFYAAKFNGDFARNQLDIDILEGGSGTPTVQMLAAGKVDYAIVSADEIVIAHDRGAKNIVALFATYQTVPQAIMTHAERGYTSIADIMHGDGILLWQSGLAYAQYFKKHYAPIRVTTAPYLGGIGNFQNDAKISQQCFVTSEPLAAKEAGINVKTFMVADSGYNPYTTVLATTREHLQQNPDEVTRLVASVRSGWSAYLQNPAPTNAKMAQLNKAMDLATFLASAQAQKALIETKDGSKLGSMTTQRWQTLVEQLLEIHMIKSSVPANQLFVDR